LEVLSYQVNKKQGVHYANKASLDIKEKKNSIERNDKKEVLCT